MEPQAQLFYNVLEAIFDYADSNIEPKGLGLMTTEKQIIMLEKAQVLEYLSVFKAFPVSILSELYRIAGCQMYIVPSYDAGASPYEYREPNQLALTKAGWIKFEIINMACEGRNEQTYQCLQGYVTNCDVQIKDPSDRARFSRGRYMPFPEIQTVEWYAKSLASAFGFKGITETNQSMEACINDWVSQALESQANPGTYPEPTGMAQEQVNWEMNQLLAQQHNIAMLNMAANMANAQAQSAASMRHALECQGSGIF